MYINIILFESMFTAGCSIKIIFLKNLFFDKWGVVSNKKLNTKKKILNPLIYQKFSNIAAH